MKLKSKFIPVITAVLLVFAMMPQLEQPAYADSTGVDFSSYVNTTTTVKFNGIEWYIIGDSTKGVRPEEGTVTLLSKKYTEATRFNQGTSDNVYKTSLIKKTLDSVFSRQYKDVSPAVKSVDLTDVEVTGANLWLLSWEEAKILTNAVLYCENNTEHALINNGWWLRTPDSDETRALLVVDADTAIPIIFPIRISNRNGLRPVLKLDLRNVDFDTETNTFNLVDSPILTHKHDNIEFSEWSNELAKTQNGIAGTGWTDVAGTTGRASIPVSDAGQKLTYKKAQFPEAPAPAPTPTPAPAKKVTTVTVNAKTINAKALENAVKAAGGKVGTVKTITLGSKVKKIAAKSFKNFKAAKTLVLKTKKLKKKSVKGSLKGSKITKIKVQVGSKKVNKKYVKKYKKIFTKKNAGKKVKVTI